MTFTRWDRIKELFGAALERSADSRSAFVAEACAEDQALRDEVLRLLVEHEQAGNFLNEPFLQTVDSYNAHNGPQSLVPGEILSRRYKIVRFIAEGGMGRVYEAEDLELGERVALKTIRPEIASCDEVIGRFKREIQIARSVSHPNVCRTFDFGYHISDMGSTIAFLTMELLSGESLSSRLKRAKRMTPEESLPIIQQLAAGLDAAHKAGVIHRDFKSSNVILVPTSGDEVRAVIADFGLARSSGAKETISDSISRKGGAIGTLEYMSPEQLKGEKTSSATDIYALGIVIYEMITGHRPFVADTPMAAALKRLTEQPRSPRTYVSGLDRRWERTILGCLESDPRNRFLSAGDVVRALRGEIGLSTRPRWRWLAIAALVALLTLSLVVYRSYSRSRLAHNSQAAETRIREGVSYQQNGQADRSKAAFEEARELYASAGDRAGVAQALEKTGDLLAQNSDFEQAKHAYEEALTICRDICAQQRVASLLTGIGIVLRLQGDISGAEKSYDAALVIYRQIGDNHGIAKMLKNKGNIARTPQQAREYWEQSLATFRKLGDKVGVAAVLDDIAGMLDEEGHLNAARQLFEEEVSIWRELDNEGWLAQALGNLAVVLYEQGMLPEAKKKIEEALSIRRREGKFALPGLLGTLGEFLWQADQLKKAREAFEEALALEYEVGTGSSVATRRLSLAELSLQEGNIAEAEITVREAAKELQLEKAGLSWHLRSLGVAAEVSVAQHRFKDARQAIGQVLPSINDIPNYGNRLSLMIIAGKVIAATGNSRAGSKYLNAVLNDAIRLGYVGFQLEARLALSEIQPGSERDRAELANLKTEASARGFMFIAHRAAVPETSPRP